MQSDAEHAIRSSAESGATVDLGGVDVRAEFLKELLVDHDQPVRAVRIRRARIVGSLDLEGMRIHCPLQLEQCELVRPIDLSETTARSIRLWACSLPSLTAYQLRTQGDLEISRGSRSGKVDLFGAQIEGSLRFDGATLENPGGVALRGYGLTVTQWLRCNDGFTAVGEIALHKSTIGCGLSFSGATLQNPDGRTLNAQGAAIGYGVFLGQSLDDAGGFVSHGEVRLVGAQVAGFVCCWEALFHNPDGIALNFSGLRIDSYLLCERNFSVEGTVFLDDVHVGLTANLSAARLHRPNGTALDAYGLSVGRNLLFRDSFMCEGAIDLTRASIGSSLDFTGARFDDDQRGLILAHLRASSLVLKPAIAPHRIDFRHASIGRFADDPAVWPQIVQMRDLVYETLDEDPTIDVAQRLDLVRRDADGYIPQPYEQLVAAYRAAGREVDARRAAFAKERQRRTVLGPLGKIWNWTVFVTIGYGYRTWHAAALLVLLLASGAFVFEAAHPTAMTATRSGPPAFNSVAYTADILLPIVNLGQEAAWQPAGAALYLSWIYVLLGWILTTAVIAGLAGILRRA